LERLRGLFATRDDPYAGVDVANATRIGGALWLIGGVVTVVLLPLAPPTDPIGAAGWPLAALMLAIALVGGIRLRVRGAAISVDELLAHSYLAVATLTVLTWLSGGLGSPYAQLYILSVVFTAAVHPPRRVVPYLGVLVVCAAAPLVYDTWNRRLALSYGTELLIWVALALVGMALMAVVRAQRLGLRREGETARRQARLDPLTGLLNRRAFDEMLVRAVEQARTAREPLSVLVGDLDGFKDINDRYGHLEGDRLLRAAADSLRQALRRPDIAYRWGGDELALILPGASEDAADHVAQRAQSAVSRHTTPTGDNLTMAVGVAEFDPDSGEDAQDLLARADLALLRAKGSGPVELPGGPG
jgi:diguanylate cyclase (GGDEF)-like protein